MATGLLDYFAQKTSAVAAEQLQLQLAIRRRLGLPQDRNGSGQRPNPFLFLLAQQRPEPSGQAWNQWLVDAGSGLRWSAVCSDPSATLQPYQRLAHHFAVARFIPSTFRPFFGQGQAVRSASRANIPRLLAALQMAKTVGARTWIRQVVRLVVLFQGGALNSFYNPRAHGAIFIRLNRKCDDYHVFEELIHQAGHAFFAILLNREPDLLRNQNALAAAFDGSDDDRTLFIALHGLVTETLIAETLFRLGASSAVAQKAVLGRLAFCLAKLGSDLNAATPVKRLFTRQGLLWLSTMARSYTSIVRALGPHLSRVDLSDQPYVFDPQLFRQKNHWLTGMSLLSEH